MLKIHRRVRKSTVVRRGILILSFIIVIVPWEGRPGKTSTVWVNYCAASHVSFHFVSHIIGSISELSDLSKSGIIIYGLNSSLNCNLSGLMTEETCLAFRVMHWPRRMNLKETFSSMKLCPCVGPLLFYLCLPSPPQPVSHALLSFSDSLQCLRIMLHDLYMEGLLFIHLQDSHCVSVAPHPLLSLQLFCLLVYFMYLSPRVCLHVCERQREREREITSKVMSGWDMTWFLFISKFCLDKYFHFKNLILFFLRIIWLLVMGIVSVT